jgi:hypothetical protein
MQSCKGIPTRRREYENEYERCSEAHAHSAYLKPDRQRHYHARMRRQWPNNMLLETCYWEYDPSSWDISGTLK